MLDFLKDTAFLIFSSLILFTTILINMAAGLVFVAPALISAALSCSSNNEISFLCLASSKIGVLALLLLTSCIALYIATNNLLPSKFLLKEVNSLLVIPLFPIGVLCTVTGLFSFYVVGVQFFLSLPNLLSAFICFLYVLLQYKT